MTVAARKYSAQDFLQLPEAPKGVRQELARGEIIVSPTPGKSHQYVSVILSSILHRHVKSHDLGIVYTDLDVVFAEDEVRAPDILFYRKERLAQIPDEHPEIPPDLAIEIISPSDPKYDRVAKFTLYQQKGVRHYWIVDPPARTVDRG